VGRGTGQAKLIFFSGIGEGTSALQINHINICGQFYTFKIFYTVNTKEDIMEIIFECTVGLVKQ
jgi:hypothetical protein